MEASLAQFLGSDPYPRFAYDSALALGYALHDLDTRNVPFQSTEDLRNAMRSVEFDGVSGFARVSVACLLQECEEKMP